MYTDRILTLIIFCLAVVLLVSCKKDDNSVLSGRLHLEFIHQVNSQPLVITDKEYTNSAGNVYRVEKLKYYVSNIELLIADGTSYKIPNAYFLVEETGLDKRTIIELPNIPSGKYTSLSFSIGVDSARNSSTEMIGDLNPNNDMAWNWVSGYKFFLLEGKFTTRSQATGAIVYHIGGNGSLRKVQLTPLNGELGILGNKITEIGILADLNKLFDAKAVVDLNQLNAIMQPGAEANTIADNYSLGMFRLHHMHVK